MRAFSKAVTPFMPLPDRAILRSSDFCELGGFLASRELLASGRDGIFRIAKTLARRAELWIPKFFCPNLTKPLAEFFDLKFYDDYPSESAPRFETLAPKNDAIVLCVDFFGLGFDAQRLELWREWKSQNSNVKLAGDFTHAPFRKSADDNIFDFAFASLRKNYALADGAWFKINGKAPSKMFSALAAPSDISDFAADFLQAAALCQTYGAESHTEAEFLYYRAETKLNARRNFGRMSAYSLKTLQRFDFEKIEFLRRRNTKIFSDKFLSAGISGVSELNAKCGKFNGDTSDKSIFAPVLKFDLRAHRDAVYDKLSQFGARPCIYWGGFGKSAEKRVLEEEGSLLAIPIDFRHSEGDALKAADIAISALCS